MANRHWRSHEIQLEFAFDRLHATKPEQVFAILVPNRERRIDESTGLKGESHENSRHLRPCLPSTKLRTGFGSTEECQVLGFHQLLEPYYPMPFFQSVESIYQV